MHAQLFSPLCLCPASWLLCDWHKRPLEILLNVTAGQSPSDAALDTQTKSSIVIS